MVANFVLNSCEASLQTTVIPEFAPLPVVSQCTAAAHVQAVLQSMAPWRLVHSELLAEDFPTISDESGRAGLCCVDLFLGSLHSTAGWSLYNPFSSEA